MPNNDAKIVVALDFDQEAKALALVEQLDARRCRLKIGKEMFTKFGPNLVRSVQARGFDVFLDLKFHDIPNTCAGAVKSAADLGVWMVNVHASGGAKMMQAARDALLSYGDQKPLLIAVTVLTSFDQEQLQQIGVTNTLAEQVRTLARLSKSCGLDGVVCSAQEATQLRSDNGSDFVLVTPGIRPAGSLPNDQIRTMTPREAMVAGSHYLVIGRPITGAVDPRTALCEIADSL